MRRERDEWLHTKRSFISSSSSQSQHSEIRFLLFSWAVFYNQFLSSSSFLCLRERWRLPTLWLLRDKIPACSKAFQQVKGLLYHTTAALQSALCIDCFKMLLLTTFPILSSEDLLSLAFCQRFPKKLKQNLQLSKLWNQSLQNSRIIVNTIFQFGKMALQLFSFFLFPQIFSYCHEGMKFMVLIWNASLLAEEQLDFLAIIYNVFSSLFSQYVVNFRVLQIIFYLKRKPESVFFIFLNVFADI